MPGRVVRREQAVRDLVDCATHLGLEAGGELAERFLKAAEGTFTKLAEHPGIGWPTKSALPELQAVRTWRVEGFDQHLVFFEPLEGGIRVLRVLHGKRDRIDHLLRFK